MFERGDKSWRLRAWDCSRNYNPDQHDQVNGAPRCDEKRGGGSQFRWRWNSSARVFSAPAITLSAFGFVLQAPSPPGQIIHAPYLWITRAAMMEFQFNHPLL